MKERLIAGIDLGSSAIRLAVGQVVVGADKRESLHLIGASEVFSQGISKGAVSSLEDAVSAISAALEQGERQIGLPISEAYVGLGGPYVTVQLTKGVIGVSRPDGEIRDEDVHRALESARSIVNPANFEILHVLPRGFTVDGQLGIKDPVGMQGIRLEVDAHIVQGQSTHVRNLTKAVFRTGLDIAELVFNPLATAEAVAQSRQRDVGVIVVNVGAVTTSVAVFEEGDLLHAAVIPIGADHITSDIAIGLRTSLDVAERLKRSVTSAFADQVSKHEEIDLRDFGAEQSEIVSPRFISDIAQARAEEIFERVEKELKKIDRSGMLPAGAVLTGGGVKLRGMTDVAKQTLRLPVGLAGAVQIQTPLIELVQDPAYATAIGLVQWGFAGERDGSAPKSGLRAPSKGGAFLEKVGSPIKKIFRSFIP
jgi:cell division protein FtsA